MRTLFVLKVGGGVLSKVGGVMRLIYEVLLSFDVDELVRSLVEFFSCCWWLYIFFCGLVFHSFYLLAG